MQMAAFIRRSSIPFSIGCYYVAECNSKWEKQLQDDYRNWFGAHEAYRRAVKLISKVQADKMNLVGQDVEDKLYKIDSPVRVISAVKKVKASYSGINRAMVMDLLTQTDQAAKSNIAPFEVTSEDEYNVFINSATSVEDRESILKLHLGLKHQYGAFAIAMASSKEAIASDKMLTTLHEKPFTLLTDNEKHYLWNTRCLFWLSLISCIGGGSWLLLAERNAIGKIFGAISAAFNAT